MKEDDIIITQSQLNSYLDLIEENKKLKENLKKFENVLLRAKKDNCLKITTDDTLDVFKEIFGDFEK